MNLFKSALLTLCFLLLTNAIILAQNDGNILVGKNLSTIKVDALTDEELAQI